uniref:Potassium/proton antiporter CemA n=1 Tax=Chaetophora lobata TaxID=1249516 RepID=A0A7U1AQ09_9CHLO|nr:chloroplast enveloppe membrane protein [Chaetophora lobata]
MLDRFYYQIYLGTAEPLVKQFRFSKYLLLTSVKSLFVVLFIPFFINIFTKIYVFRPLVEYFWDRKQTEIFLNYELQEKAFSEIRNFEEKMYFDYLIKTENFAEHPFFGPITGHRQEPPDSRLWPIIGAPDKLENYTSGIFSKPRLPVPSEQFFVSSLSAKLRGERQKTRKKLEVFFLEPRTVPSEERQSFALAFSHVHSGPLRGPKQSFERKSEAFSFSHFVHSGPFAALSEAEKEEINYQLRRNFSSDSAKFSISSLQDWNDFKLSLNYLPKYPSINSLNCESQTLIQDLDCGVLNLLLMDSLLHVKTPIMLFDAVKQADASSLPSANIMRLEQNLRDNHFSFVSFPNAIAVERPSIIFNKNTESIFRQKTRELANHYNNESISAITNLLADFMGLLILLFLLVNMKMSLMNTTAFLSESFFSLKDSKKAFLMLLFTDLLVGFHSPRGWEVIFHFLFEHFGLPENHNIIFLLVGTFPVLLDALFKYWIFRHLNRHSPATVATFQAMVE